jgi:hypothetical protein
MILKIDVEFCPIQQLLNYRLVFLMVTETLFVCFFVCVCVCVCVCMCVCVCVCVSICVFVVGTKFWLMQMSVLEI